MYSYIHTYVYVLLDKPFLPLPPSFDAPHRVAMKYANFIVFHKPHLLHLR